MGKYALLLHNISKHSEMRYRGQLREAESLVKFQLRHGNDLLAMDSIVDCPVNLKEQGELKRQVINHYYFEEGCRLKVFANPHHKKYHPHSPNEIGYLPIMGWFLEKDDHVPVTYMKIFSFFRTNLSYSVDEENSYDTFFCSRILYCSENLREFMEVMTFTTTNQVTRWCKFFLINCYCCMHISSAPGRHFNNF